MTSEGRILIFIFFQNYKVFEQSFTIRQDMKVLKLRSTRDKDEKEEKLKNWENERMKEKREKWNSERKVLK